MKNKKKSRKKVIIRTNCAHHTFDLLTDLIAEEKAKKENDRDLEQIERYKKLLRQGKEVSHHCKFGGRKLDECGCGNCRVYVNINKVE